MTDERPDYLLVREKTIVPTEQYGNKELTVEFFKKVSDDASIEEIEEAEEKLENVVKKRIDLFYKATKGTLTFDDLKDTEDE